MGPDACRGTNVRGEPCGKLPVGSNGFCQTHSPGGLEQARAAGRAGGEAHAQEYARAGLADGELPVLSDTQSVYGWYNVVGRAYAERRITDKEVANLTRLADSFGERLEHDMTATVTEFKEVVAEKEREIAQLRQQMRPRVA